MSNHTQPLSRSANRQQKKYKGGKGKFIAIFITLLIIAGAAAALMWQMNGEKQKETFASHSTTLEKDVQKDLEQSGIPLASTKSGSTYKQEILFLPKEENANVDVLKEQLAALMAKGKTQLKDNWGKVIGYVNVHHITDQLTQYQPVAVSYTWNKNKSTFTKKEFDGENGSFINQQTGVGVTAKDLFAEKADYYGLLEVMQQNILDQSKDAAGIIDKVLALEVPTAETLKFTYEADKFVVHLADASLGMTDVNLSYNDLASYINTSLVDPTQITTEATALDTTKKYVSLTFDDGPNSATTPGLLDTLKEKGVKATFFNVGENASTNAELLKRIVAEGHEIGNHSWDHVDFTASSMDVVKKEVRDTNKAIYLATGKLPHFCRPPYGAVNAEAAEAIGMPVIQWNLDSTDWELKNAEATKEKVLNSAFNGAIILLHDIHQTSVDAVPGIIDGLRAKGYEFVSLEQMLGTTKPLYQYFGLYKGQPDDRIIE